MVYSPSSVQDVFRVTSLTWPLEFLGNNWYIRNSTGWRHSCNWTAIGDRSFSIAGPRVWNILPAFVRDTNSSLRFRKLLKTFLFVCRPRRRWRWTGALKWIHLLTYRKCHVAYLVGTNSSDLEWLWRSLLPFETYLIPILWDIWHVLTAMCLHVNRRAHAACNFKWHVKTEGFFKATGSHVDCKSGTTSEVVQDKRRCYYRSLIGSNIWSAE